MNMISKRDKNSRQQTPNKWIDKWENGVGRKGGSHVGLFFTTDRRKKCIHTIFFYPYVVHANC